MPIFHGFARRNYQETAVASYLSDPMRANCSAFLRVSIFILTRMVAESA
jgi:hypothetical protein